MWIQSIGLKLTLGTTFLSLYFPIMLADLQMGMNIPKLPCHECRITLVESIPENLTYPAGAPSHLSTYAGWMNLLDLATESIDIASFYWTLRGKDIYKDPSDWQGEKIYNRLASAASDKKIRLRIAVNSPSKYQNDLDVTDLQKLGAKVRLLNFTEFFGNGVLHTKLWIIDGKHFYVGSANMDWRSLTQVKELGAIIQNCSCLASDVLKIFDVYWYMGKPGAKIPPSWPSMYQTKYNMDTPMKLMINGTPSNTYLSSSPPKFCPMGRTSDIIAILDVINKAKKYIYVAVMDYSPTTVYSMPRQFWPVIDDALKKVALEKNVQVRLMASWWNNSNADMKKYLKSLSDLNCAMNATIQTKLFLVPAFTPSQKKIPFSRVNHNKYMVTDNTAYIGTSNWSGDYFISTGGVGLVINQGNFDMNASKIVIKELTEIFKRDWSSVYALPVRDYLSS